MGADETPDGVCSIFRVNTGLRQSGPSSDYDTVVAVTVAFEETEDQGMPTAAATESLGALEHRITSALRQGDHSVLASVVTTAERGRTFTFYTRSADALTETIAGVVGLYRAPCESVRHGHDPQWRGFGDDLAHALAGESDVHLVMRLQAAGTDPRRRRTVDHVLHFASPEAATAASTGPLAALAVAEPVIRSDGAWSVVVSVDHTLEFASLARWRRQLKEAASEFGGTYDGWGTRPDAET
jgi:hypothetical protein